MLDFNDDNLIVYTCLIGDNEGLNAQPFFSSSKLRHVCLTDNKKLKSNDWEIILVDRIMNSTDIKITVRLSLISRILSRLGVLILANNIPITVTDNKPDSGCRVSAPANANITKPKDRTLIKK